MCWDHKQVDEQVLTKTLASPDARATLFDPDSIMEYPVAAQLTTDREVIGWTLDLSPTDKELIAEFYPEPTSPAYAQQSHASAAGERQTAGGG